jgi:hypothetical protein
VTSRTQSSELGTESSDGDTPMTATYVRVVVLEAVIIVALWVLGRVFS